MTNKRKRNPLDKEKFLVGLRQKWCAIFLLYSFVILVIQIIYKIDPYPYMNFSIAIGSLFMLGGSVDSALKIDAAKKLKLSNVVQENSEEEPTDP